MGNSSNRQYVWFIRGAFIPLFIGAVVLSWVPPKKNEVITPPSLTTQENIVTVKEVSNAFPSEPVAKQSPIEEPPATAAKVTETPLDSVDTLLDNGGYDESPPKNEVHLVNGFKNRETYDRYKEILYKIQHPQ